MNSIKSLISAALYALAVKCFGLKLVIAWEGKTITHHCLNWKDAMDWLSMYRRDNGFIYASIYLNWDNRFVAGYTY